MKYIFFIILAVILLITGCSDEEITYEDMILGLWVNTHVNYKPVLTDQAFACDYRADLSQLYAIGLVFDEDNKSWVENTAYTYTIDREKITVKGPDIFGNNFHMEFAILFLDKDTLRYDVTTFKINGEEFPDPDTYTLARVKTDLSDDFAGTWYGRSTTPGAPDTYHYWDYFADGTFDYYFQDEDGNWINKPDNDGEYFLYGNLLATNYSNDLQTGEAGRAFECWNITIDGDHMTWRGLRENGLVASFEMNRVEGPPL